MIEHIQSIKEHFDKEYPREGCGVLAVQKGKLKWFPCTNVAEDNEDFVINSAEYLKLSRTSDIVGIVHSHPDADCTPSESDIKYCNALGIKYYIFSYPEMELYTLEPTHNIKELYGREYEFGVADCFEAMRDYLASQQIQIKPRLLFEDDWWKKGLNYFTDEVVKDWGFKPVLLSEIQPNDMLVFNVFSDVPNHCGVYLGNEIFYHHQTQWSLQRFRL
jgi:proteasome lid subunit RPN8/RPN11